MFARVNGDSRSMDIQQFKRFRGAVLRAAYVALCLTICGCGVIDAMKPKSTPSRVESTVGRVTADYIQAVFEGTLSRLETFINWPSMLDRGLAGEGGFTRADFEKQLASLQGRWTLEEHPLYGLVISDIDVDGNDAEVELKRTNGNGYPTIEISLLWVGNGWVITKDSLFGRGKLVEQWQQDPAAFKRPPGSPVL